MTHQDQHNRDPRGGYRVPDGYFNDLNHLIVEKAQMPAADNSWSGALRRMIGFAGGFAFMVALAVGAFYLISDGNPESVTQLTSQQNNLYDFTQMYNVSEDDILEYYLYPTDSSELNNQQFAQAVDEYIQIYGMEIDDL